jgi:hypothetical protein
MAQSEYWNAHSTQRTRTSHCGQRRLAVRRQRDRGVLRERRPVPLRSAAAAAAASARGGGGGRSGGCGWWEEGEDAGGDATRCRVGALEDLAHILQWAMQAMQTWMMPMSVWSVNVKKKQIVKKISTHTPPNTRLDNRHGIAEWPRSLPRARASAPDSGASNCRTNTRSVQLLYTTTTVVQRSISFVSSCDTLFVWGKWVGGMLQYSLRKPRSASGCR